MNAENEKFSRYITSFDGIRTIAVIGVILYHLMPNVLKGGYLGVPIFFVLSGYLITDLLKQELIQTKKIDVLGFYRRRMKRLYPGLVVMLLVTSAYSTIFQHSFLNNLRGAMLSSLTYVNNLWQIHLGTSYFNHFNSPSPYAHIWSLAIEGQFYFVWPILFFMCIKFLKKNQRIFGLLVLFSFLSMLLMWGMFSSGQDATRVYYGTDTRIFSLLLGSALAFLWPSYKMKESISLEAKKWMNRAGAGALLILVLSFLFMGDKMALTYRFGMYFASLVVALLVAVCAHPASAWSRFLSNPVFTYIGTRSYSIYLWQYPIMMCYEAKIASIGKHLWLHSLVELLLIFGVSECSYRFVEVPMKQFDYAQTGSLLKEIFSAPFQVRRKIPYYLGALLVLLSLFGCLIAPSGVLTKNEKALQETISQNAKKAKQHQEEIAKEQANGQKISNKPEEKIDEKYKLTKAQAEAAANLSVTAFGDSIMLACAPELQQLFPYMYIDATVGRQLYDCFDDLEKLEEEGKLSEVLLVSLGTNGSWTSAQFERFMAIIGENRLVFWNNVYVPTKRWQETVNDALTEEAKKYKNLHVINWYQTAKDHEDWFYTDKVHPNEVGIPFYTKIVGQGILIPEVVQKVQEEIKKATEEANKKESAQSTPPSNEHSEESTPSQTSSE